ncbi:DUF1694 domain-containing protein [Loigolactobacillus bifermentans]|jgi:uncharacterized protein YueI|uniref:DUF1694 domain-containing protein n=1 Tax=Loigolactobacillus bifermentans DSM 20003 TaxID=1423726 RepID=A0A0R1GE94_9LACO|nr:DUF1694 domain-containing protein [Loigolactobacillus bifermentans]KRK32405.1 hypothetical protein FC07_GL002231 [Loigolactobacillus bifermentans DSM 20003]QGG60673.1 DUF1694 domain-containing protein [Loigolactobacillus bifermentans]
MSKKTEDYIKRHLFTQPQIKPDERRAFLGNYRDRVALALTIQQLRATRTLPMVTQILKRYPQYRLYLNGRMGETLIQRYLQLALKLDYPFTILTQKGIRKTPALKESDFGLVVAAKDAASRQLIIF